MEYSSKYHSGHHSVGVYRAPGSDWKPVSGYI